MSESGLQCAMTDATLKRAIAQQYHAALAMLGEAIRVCPDALWTQGTHPRQFWRIAHHAVFFAHLYMERSTETFVPWALEREGLVDLTEEPLDPTPYTKAELLDYWQQVDAMVDAKIDALDLDSPDSGFYWYENFPKLDHLLLAVRHIQEHAGQLRDRNQEAGAKASWVSRG